MKQTIRLTESELKRLIKSCINEAKDRFSWQNYAAAAKEAERRGDKRKDAFLNAATNSLKNKFPNRHYLATSYTAGKDIPHSVPNFHEEGWFNPYLSTKYGYMNANIDADNAAFSPCYYLRGEYHKSFGDRGVKGWGKSKDNYDRYDKISEPSSIITADDTWDVKTPTDNEGEWDFD